MDKIKRMKEILLEHTNYDVKCKVMELRELFNNECIKASLSSVAIAGFNILEEETHMDKQTHALENWEVYKIKNERYGDSFGKSYKKYGEVVLKLRVEDKINRLEQLENGTPGTCDENKLDTIADMVNYCCMGLMELECDEIG